MGPSLEDNNDTANSLRDRLLFVNKKNLDYDMECENCDATSPDAPAGNAVTGGSSERSDGVEICAHYVIGQWIFLYLSWSNMRDLVYGFNAVSSIMAWSLVMAGHFFFLAKLSLLFPGGRKESRGRTAQVNQETLPVILSGLRMFRLDSGDTADKFLVVIAVSFLLFELCRGSFGDSTHYMMFAREKHSFDEMAEDYYEHHRQSNRVHTIDQLEAQHENSVSQNVESQADDLENEKKDELDSRIGTQTGRRDWGVICQWIWLAFVWVFIRHFIEYKAINLLRDDEHAYILTWLVAMSGHGIFLAERISKSHKVHPFSV